MLVMAKTLVPAALALWIAGVPTFALADDACMTQATDLAGAAKTRFMTYCEKTACQAQAVDKKLHGAAQTSFVKKCVTDAMTGAATTPPATTPPATTPPADPIRNREYNTQ